MGDISDIIKKHYKSATNTELVNLFKSSFAMDKIDSARGILSLVHEECVSRWRDGQLDDLDIEFIRN